LGEKDLDSEDNVLIICTVYIVGILLFLISVAMPYIIVVKATQSPPYELYYGYFLLIFGGWFGFIFILISAILLYHQKTGSSVLFGVLGCILLIFNFLFILYYCGRFDKYYILLGYFIGLSATLIFLHINILVIIFIKHKIVD